MTMCGNNRDSMQIKDLKVGNGVDVDDAPRDW